MIALLGFLWMGLQWHWRAGGVVNVSSSSGVSIFASELDRMNERGMADTKLILVLSGDWTRTTKCVLELYIVSNGNLVLTQCASVQRLTRSSRPDDPRVIHHQEGIACGVSENSEGALVPVLQGVGGLAWGRTFLRSPSGFTKGIEQTIEGPLSVGRKRVIFTRTLERVPIESSDDPAEIAEKVGEGAVIVFGMLEES